MGQAFEKYWLIDTKNAILGSYESRSILDPSAPSKSSSSCLLEENDRYTYMCICVVMLYSELASCCRCHV